MKRYRLVYRGSRDTYCSFDTHTKKRESLGTGDAVKAQRLVDAKNEAVQHTEMNLQIAQVYLQHSDPTLASRTWQDVMEKILSLKTGPTRERWQYAINDKAFDALRHRRLLQTNAEHFLTVLNNGSVATNVFCAAPIISPSECTGCLGRCCRSCNPLIPGAGGALLLRLFHGWQCAGDSFREQ